MTLADLADALADEYGIDRDAARNRVEEIADRLPAGMYDPTTGTLADDGEAAIRDQVAADYHGMTNVSGRHDDLLAGIREAADQIAEHQRLADEWMRRRDEMIRTAIREGVRVPAIAEAAGLDRQRVYQIRDRRR
jgi:hypothetical protein